MSVENSEVGVANLKGVIDIAKQSLKSLEILNGGAAVAILAFYSSISKDSDLGLVNINDLRTALCIFGAGLFLSILSSFSAYASQLIVATSNSCKYELWTRCFAILLALASAVAFLCGSISFAKSLAIAKSPPIHAMKISKEYVLPSERWNFCIEKSAVAYGDKKSALNFCESILPSELNNAPSGGIERDDPVPIN